MSLKRFVFVTDASPVCFSFSLWHISFLCVRDMKRGSYKRV